MKYVDPNGRSEENSLQLTDEQKQQIKIVKDETLKIINSEINALTEYENTGKKNSLYTRMEKNAKDFFNVENFDNSDFRSSLKESLGLMQNAINNFDEKNFKFDPEDYSFTLQEDIFAVCSMSNNRPYGSLSFNVVFRRKFFKSNSEQQINAFIHEFTHGVLNTQDYNYNVSEMTGRYLSTSKKRSNASNWAYFILNSY